MKIGILGYGSIGRRHAVNLLRLGHSVVVYDPDFGPDHHTQGGFLNRGTRAEVVEGTDGVLICSPTAQHVADLSDIPCGTPVLVEKPIGLPHQIEDVRYILTLRVAPTMVGCNLRFHPAVRRAEEWLDGGAIGRVIHAAFSLCQAGHDKYRSEGVLLNAGAHEIDLAAYLLGPTKVDGCTATRDLAIVYLAHGEVTTSVFLHWHDLLPRLRHVIIRGSAGVIRLELENGAVERRRGRDLLDSVVFSSEVNDDYIAEIEEFISVAGGAPFKYGATGRDGLATLELISAAQKMAA